MIIQPNAKSESFAFGWISYMWRKQLSQIECHNPKLVERAENFQIALEAPPVSLAS